MKLPNFSRGSQKRFLSALLYAAALLICYFGVYTFLFIPSYQSAAAETTGKSDSTEPEYTDSSSDSEDKPACTIYPDSGQNAAVVLLDAGHGGYDGGKTDASGTILEKDINLNMALLVQKYLQQINPNLEIKMVRTDDEISWADNEIDDLNYRTDLQEQSGAQYFISFHSNALDDPEVRGYQFFINSTDDAAAGMSELIRQYLSNDQEWIPYHSTQIDQRLQAVYLSKIHSILIEMGFMTNAEDLALLTNQEKMDQAAQEIACAVSEYIMQHPDQTDPAQIRQR